jgi:hypothetical protein
MNIQNFNKKESASLTCILVMFCNLSADVSKAITAEVFDTLDSLWQQSWI